MVLVSVWILWIRNGERAPRGKGLNLLDNVWGPQLGEGGGLSSQRLGRFKDPCTPMSVPGLGRLGPLAVPVASPCSGCFLTAWLL